MFKHRAYFNSNTGAELALSMLNSLNNNKLKKYFSRVVKPPFTDYLIQPIGKDKWKLSWT